LNFFCSRTRAVASAAYQRRTPGRTGVCHADFRDARGNSASSKPIHALAAHRTPSLCLFITAIIMNIFGRANVVRPLLLLRTFPATTRATPCAFTATHPHRRPPHPHHALAPQTFGWRTFLRPLPTPSLPATQRRTHCTAPRAFHATLLHLQPWTSGSLPLLSSFSGCLYSRCGTPPAATPTRFMPAIHFRSRTFATAPRIFLFNNATPHYAFYHNACPFRTCHRTAHRTARRGLHRATRAAVTDATEPAWRAPAFAVPARLRCTLAFSRCLFTRGATPAHLVRVVYYAANLRCRQTLAPGLRTRAARYYPLPSGALYLDQYHTTCCRSPATAHHFTLYRLRAGSAPSLGHTRQDIAIHFTTVLYISSSFLFIHTKPRFTPHTHTHTQCLRRFHLGAHRRRGRGGRRSGHCAQLPAAFRSAPRQHPTPPTPACLHAAHSRPPTARHLTCLLLLQPAKRTRAALTGSGRTHGAVRALYSDDVEIALTLDIFVFSTCLLWRQGVACILPHRLYRRTSPCLPVHAPEHLAPSPLV